MTELSVTMPPALQSWVDRRIAEGAYADAADYLRDLVRRDRKGAGVDEDRARLRAMIEEGLASGIMDRTPEEVLDDIIREDPDLRG